MTPQLIGTLISAAAGLGGNLYGNIAAKKNAEKQEGVIRGLQQDNENWYNRRYNEDFTQRADAQRVLQQASNTLRERNKAAQGRAAVMGATADGVAAEKEANSQAYADAVSRVAAAGASNKDAIEQQYMQQKANLEGQLGSMYGNRAANTSLAGSQAMAAGGQLAGAFLDADGNLFGQKEKEEGK